MRAINTGAPMRRQLKADLKLMFSDYIHLCRPTPAATGSAKPSPAESPKSPFDRVIKGGGVLRRKGLP